MSDPHSDKIVRAVDRTTTTVVDGLGKLNLPQRAETALGATDRAVGAITDHVDRATQNATAAADTARAAGASFSAAGSNIAAAAGNATQAGLSAGSSVLNAGSSVIRGAQAATTAGGIIARPIKANVRMGKDVVSTLQAGADGDDGAMVKQGLIGNPERALTNPFLPPSMRGNVHGTAARLAKHVTVDVVKGTITSYRDAKRALTHGKEAAGYANRAGRAGVEASKNTARAGQNLMRGARAASAGTGQATRAGVHAAKPAARATGRVLSNAATAAVRGAQVAMAAIRSVVAGLVSVMSSTSPLIIAIVAIISVVVLIFTWFGWLLPDLIDKDKKAPNPGEYGVAPPGPWGGHQNGYIPEDELSELETAPGYFLRSDGAEAFALMNTAYRAEFGENIIVSDAYRDYAGQEYQRERWCGLGNCDNAAPPGTSNHGWALALDLGGGINSWTSAEHAWMDANAATYGYYNPPWAAADLKDEPWHWDFWGMESNGSGGALDAEGDAQEYAKKRVIDDRFFGLNKDGPEAQWACLKQLWNGESNWNYLAENPSSGAYGIPQALPGDKMASHGDDWATNYKTQIEWGLDYITDRYYTPCGAWDFWNSQDPHWY